MKKSIFLFLILSALLMFSVNAFADTSGNVEFYIDTGGVEIAGDVGTENNFKTVTLMLTDNGVDVNSIKPENVGYIGQTVVKEDGTYKVKFNLKKGKKLNDYNVFVKNGEEDLTSSLKTVSYHMYKGCAFALDISRSYQGIEAHTIAKQLSDETEISTYTVSIAFYDKYNKLLSLTIPQTVNISELPENTVISEVPENAAKAKALVWRNFEKIDPIIPNAEIDCGDIAEYMVVFPGFTTKALTMSYDDGDSSDEQLVRIFNENNIKATFNVYRDNQEYKSRYAGHEITSHSKGHLNMLLSAEPVATTEECVAAIKDGKTMVENLMGEGTCNGFVWPFGVPSNRDDFETLMQTVKDNYLYARPVVTSKSLSLPTDWYNWQATCHHNKVYDYVDEFLEDDGEIKLLYVWGHSYELLDKYQNDDGSTMTYDDLEQFCKEMGARDDVWKATNFEVYEYVNAMRSLEKTDNYIYNPSETDLYVIVDGNKTILKSKTYVGGTN